MITEIKYKDHEEWLAIRGKYIGGSDAGAVIGMNPYKSAYTLWAEKTGKLPQFEGNVTTKVGAYLEEFVAKMFEDETGKKVRRKNATMVNDLYPWACANIDRAVVGEKALLEIKTTNSVPIMRQLRNDESFPDAYYAQVVHYLAVTGFDKAYLAVLVNCREFKVYELERDQSEVDALMSAEKDFWQLVEKKTPPSVDGTESTEDTLQTLYPESNGNTADLYFHKSILDEYAELKQQKEAIEALMTEKTNIIKEYMQEAERGECEGWKVSYKTQSGRTTFDHKKFAKDHPKMDLSKYTKQGQPIRVFKITEVKSAKPKEE